MANYEDKDFIGFSFNGTHSSSFGIIRTSNGSRYDESLLPQVQDKTIQVPGGDGTYYFGSQYTQRPFSISIAFDSLSEKGFIDMQNWLNQREPKRLIFDERPYKYYLAKVSNSTQSLKYLCFEKEFEEKDEKGELKKVIKRVYKGEGTLNFVCYYPFAKSVFKYLDSYKDNDYPNKDQWAESSQMEATQGVYDTFKIADDQSASVMLWNAGNLPTDWFLKLALKEPKQDTELTFKLIKDNEKTKTMILKWNEAEGETMPTSITINSKNNSIVNSGAPSELWTGLLKEGEFFKIPLGASKLTITSNVSIFSQTVTNNPAIDYDYLYF